jgi:hypothetical protein
MRAALMVMIGVALLGAGCSRFTGRSKAAVRTAIEEHLRRQPGLQMQNMTMELQDVTFQGNTAEARVRYVSKQSPDIFVQIRYELRRQSSGWEVQSSSLEGGMGPGSHAAMSPGSPAAAPSPESSPGAAPAPQPSH